MPAVALVLICKVLLDDKFEPYLKSVLLAGFMLPVTGAALIWASFRAGGERDYRDLTQRSRNYTNLFNPARGFMQARNSDGSWIAVT